MNADSSVADENKTYTYNNCGQLTSFSNSLGDSASYTYYSDGMRESKTVGTDVTTYYYDGANIINESLNDSDYATNVMGVGGILSRKQNSTIGYYFDDAHGDIKAIYSASGTKLADYTYDAWGKQTETGTGTWAESNPFRYNGQYYDEESGLTYLRARYYDSDIRRFITEDPAEDGVNWYAYCGNNPVMYVDPSGCNAQDILDYLNTLWNNVKWAFTEAVDVANETQKSMQRSFWKTGSEKLLGECYNYQTSPWMLEHSLQDNPSDIWRGNDSWIAYLINNDEAYLSALDKAIARSDDGTVKRYLEDVIFCNGDLYYSIHRATIYVEGYQKDDGSWIIKATLTDTYDFTKIQTFMDDNGGISKNAGLGTIANDAAVISQKTGAIVPYGVTVEFYTTR